MKKYVKPQIKFEFFALSESIATSCDMETGWLVRGSQSIPNCYAQTEIMDQLSGTKAFSTSLSGCNYTPDDHCYSYFSETANLTYSSY